MSQSGAGLMTKLLRLAGNRGFLLYLANFGLGKGLAFTGPIFLGLLLGPQLYGAIEFGLALGMIGAMIAMAGVPQAMMQIVLIRRDRKVDDLLLTSVAVIAALSFIAALACWRFGLGGRYQIAAAIVALCAAQQSGVAYARAHGWPNVNVWVDHAPTVVVVVMAGLMASFGAANDLALTATLLAGLAGLVSLFSCCFAWRQKNPDMLRRLREAVGVGLPLVAASLAGTWIIASGRIWFGMFLSDDDVSAYAFTFRVASLLVLIHAVVATAFAATLYKMPTRRFDVVAAALVAVIAALTVVFIFLDPARLAARWSASANESALAGRAATALVPAQIFFWVAGAMVETRLARARAAWVATRYCLAAALGAGVCVAALYATQRMEFAALAGLMLAQQFAYCAAIHFAMARRRLPLRRAAMSTLIGGGIVLGAALLKAAA